MRRILFAGMVGLVALALASTSSTRPVDDGSALLQDDPLAGLISLGLPIYCGGGHGPYVALTFDDGPGFETRALLDLLRSERVPATFFLVGEHVVRYPGLTREEASLGVVGDHSWSHPFLPGLSAEQIADQVLRTQEAIETRAGTSVELFRPPFGARDASVDTTAREIGLLEVLWSVDSGDASEAKTPSAETIYDNLVSRIRPGAIVLMHENIVGGPTVEALELLLPELRRRGLVAVTVPELLTLDPPDLGQIENGKAGCAS